MVVNRKCSVIRNTSLWDAERSALQTLHKVSGKAREQNYFQGGTTHSWVSYYENRIESDRSCLNEWHTMDNLESRRPPSPDSVRTKPTQREETERVIRATLKEIMMSVDLDEVTSKVIRTRLEEDLDMDLAEYKSFIDQEMLVILGQMDAPTEIFDHVYLGSEWNASNYEELQRNGVGHILNVTREIDNFFPGTFDYLNIRVYDDEKTDLLKHWDNTFKYITKARENGSKVLVHCKMGVSRSASVVIAYAMKAYNWDFNTALQHVKDKRSCIKPNTSFLSQLETYQGILDAMKNREKLQRSKSETNLKSPGRNAKTEKVVTGSEPTPIVQALSKSYDMQTTGEDLKQLGARPKSWSPDNVVSSDLLHGSKSSPVFLSLENLSQKSSSKESVKSQQTDGKPSSFSRERVVMPCDNGESYSVSPNQIVHLSGHNDHLPASVRDRINAMDGRNGEEKKKLVLNLTKEFSSEACDYSSLNTQVVPQKETWDPGEAPMDATANNKSTSDACDSVNESQSTTVWTSSTVLKSVTQSAVTLSSNLNKVPDTVRHKPRKESDVFSNQLDRVFDREEKKQQRTSMLPNLPSSVPELSTTTQSRECPSRQNSWGSYDSAVVLSYQSENSDVLSRQNSWGSGDTRTLLSRNSSWGSYDMRNRNHVGYNNERDKPTEAINTSLVTAIEEKSSAISEKIDIPPNDDHNKFTNNSRLSISAPEPSSMELISQECSLSRSASNVSENTSSVISTAQCSSVKQHRSFLENLSKDSRILPKIEHSDLLESSSGMVRNLKKEFEAKSSTNIDMSNLEAINSEAVKSKNRLNSSLPSSPIILHQTKEVREKSEDNINLLIYKFENNDDSHVSLRRPKSKPTIQNRNTRHSCIEVGERSSLNYNRSPFLSEKNEGGFRKPPLTPVVRNSPPKLVVAKTVIATAAAKKQQQYGKSHPLARLSIKPRQNNPIYNTM